MLDVFVKVVLKIHRFLPPFIFRILVIPLGIHFVREINGGYNVKYLDNKKPISLLFGYWQSEKYFFDVRNEIRDTFKFKKNYLTEKTRKLQEEIRKCSSSVSLHIRRGDFVDEGIMIEDIYYYRSIKILRQYVPNPVFYVFSDDMEYAKTLNIPNVVYVDCNKGKDSWQDMFLMSSCRHNIIANSTFSWWGAYLNENKGKIVIAPKEMRKFNRDIFPEEYIVI